MFSNATKTSQIMDPSIDTVETTLPPKAVISTGVLTSPPFDAMLSCPPCQTTIVTSSYALSTTRELQTSYATSLTTPVPSTIPTSLTVLTSSTIAPLQHRVRNQTRKEARSLKRCEDDECEPCSVVANCNTCLFCLNKKLK